MSRLILLLFVCASHFAWSQNVINLESEWLMFKEGQYVPRSSDAESNTVYFALEPTQHPAARLLITSSRPYFLFINGKIAGEYAGKASLSLDSLGAEYSAARLMLCVYQREINPRDLKTQLIKSSPRVNTFKAELKPSTYFKDFVTLTGLIIAIFFVVVAQVNPKLASDYFSVAKIFSPREADDAQSNARLTSSNNFQFYIGCSMLIAFYLLIVLYHLPVEYALPLKFRASSFWVLMWQWLKLSLLVLLVFLLKIVIIFTLTRLFNMKGLARVHFFNWVRLLLIVFGIAALFIFSYYILRGQNESIFVAFLSLIVATLIGWIFIVFMKLNGKTEHSMFHLFSYICATELIPLLITIKVLFQ